MKRLIGDCVVRKYHHPAILQLMGLCQTEDLEGLVLVYERVSCGSLYAFLHNKVSNASCCALLSAVCMPRGFIQTRTSSNLDSIL